MKPAFCSLLGGSAKAAIAILVLIGFAERALPELPPLVPREILLGQPQKFSPSLSSDGE